MTNGNVTVTNIVQWHEMAMRGKRIPLYIPINGVSMMPLIRRNRDQVCIVPLFEQPQAGDIVLFSDPYAERRYVLHRLWRIDQENALTWGDNCDGPDRSMPVSCIWGKVVLIDRGRLRIRPQRRCGMLLAHSLHLLRRLRHVAYALGRPVYRAVRGLFHIDGRG